MLTDIFHFFMSENRASGHLYTKNTKTKSWLHSYRIFCRARLHIEEEGLHKQQHQAPCMPCHIELLLAETITADLFDFGDQICGPNCPFVVHFPSSPIPPIQT